MRKTLAFVILTAIGLVILLNGPVGSLFTKCSTTPTWLIFTSLVICIPAIFYLIYKTFFDKEDENGKTNFVKRNRGALGSGIVLGTVLLGFVSKNSLDNVLVIDNGTERKIEIAYTDRTKTKHQIEVPAGGTSEITLPIGKNELTVDGTVKEMQMGPRGNKYIYNVDKSNAYFLMKIEYGNEADTNFMDRLQGVYTDEFIDVQADYLFEAPERIFSRRSSSKTKHVLLRINEDEVGEEKKDSSRTEN